MNKNSFVANFQGQVFYDSTLLFSALLEKWDLGKEYVFNGNLNYQNKNSKEYLNAFIEKQTLAPNEQEYTDVIFFRLMYSLEKIDRFYWKNTAFDSLQDYGNALADLAVKLLKSRTYDLDNCILPVAKMTDHEARMILGAEDFLNNDIWDYYLTKRLSLEDLSSRVLCKNIADGYREQFNRLKIFYGAKDLDPCIKALGIAHVLTGREDFVIENHYFSSIDEFQKEVKSKYEDDLNDYFIFFAKGASDLDALQEIFPKNKFEEFHKYFPARDNFMVLNNGEYMFRNVKEFYEFIKELSESEELTELKSLRDKFLYSIKKDLLKIESRMRPYTRKIIDIMESLVCFDDLIFKNVDSLVDHLNELAQQNKLFEIYRFLQIHDKSMHECYRQMPPSKAIEFCEKIKEIYLFLQQEMPKAGFIDQLTADQIREILNPDEVGIHASNDKSQFVDKEDFSIPDNSSIFTVDDPLEDALALVPGETVYFGKYFKDVSEKKGFYTAKDLEWKVIYSDSQKALLITTSVIDSRFYHAEHEYANWENCELREWLNTEFIDLAFTKEQQTAILLSLIRRVNGKNTEDLIFLLSDDEANKYIKDDKDRFCQFTEYAKAKGLTHLGFNPQTTNKEEPNSTCWWLRSTYTHKDYYGALIMNQDGKLEIENEYTSGVGIRPAMWVNLNLIKKLPD